MAGENEWVIVCNDGRGEDVLFWRPNSAGYTHDLNQAGRYSEKEAKDAARRGDNKSAFRLSDVLALARPTVDRDALRIFAAHDAAHGEGADEMSTDMTDAEWEAAIKENLRLGYFARAGRNERGEQLYRITKKGKASVEAMPGGLRCTSGSCEITEGCAGPVPNPRRARGSAGGEGEGEG